MKTNSQRKNVDKKIANHISNKSLMVAKGCGKGRKEITANDIEDWGDKTFQN